MKKLTVVAAAASAALLGGCAPQFNFAQGPYGCGAVEQSALHRTSVMATTQRVQRLQAKYSLSARYVAANPQSWRSAATGECR